MSILLRTGLEEVLRIFKSWRIRVRSVNLLHPLGSVVVIAIMAVLAGANGPTAIARWANMKAELLVEGCWSLPHGIPQKDVFRRVLCCLKPDAFQACFTMWLAALRAAAAEATGVERPMLAIDGKTLRRSHDRRNGSGGVAFGQCLGERVRPVARASGRRRRNRTKSRRFPSCCRWSTSREPSSPSTRWGRKRPSPSRSSTAKRTTCWP